MRLNYNILKDLCEIASPSGYEHEICSYIKNLKPKHFVYNETKKLSCSYEINIKAPKTIYIDAHIDTVHLKIISIDKNNYVIAMPVGFDGLVTDGLLLVHLNTGFIGAVSTMPPHLSLERRTSDEVWIDFGLPKKEMSDFKIGDYIVFSNNYKKIGKNSITASGLDDKCGVFILISLLRYFDTAKNIKKLKYNLILNFSSREETGLGSFAKVKTLKIDEIFTLDTIYSTGIDLIPDYITSAILTNGGALITRNSDDDLELGNKIIKVAEQKKIPFQIGYTGNDNGGSNNQWFSKNIDSLAQNIGIPLKHMHSPNEMVSTTDLRYTYLLFISYLCE